MQCAKLLFTCNWLQLQLNAEIARVGGHYAVQGHSRSPILVPIESLQCYFLLVINTNIHPISDRFQLIALSIVGGKSLKHTRSR